MRPAASNPSSGRPAQQGMTLIELLVGMFIGLLVTLAAVSSLIFVRMSAATAEEAGRLQQDSNLAFRVIGWQLRQAGARPLVMVSPSSMLVEFASGYTGYGLATDPQPMSGVDGASNSPDVLRASVQNDPAADARDCLGMAPSGTTINILNQFSVVDGNLSCTGTSNTAALASGVEDMQVWYGESDGIGYRYRTVPVDWKKVTAVLVCLRMVGERPAQVTTDTTGCNNEVISADGRLRRTFMRVFQIRNRVETATS